MMYHIRSTFILLFMTMLLFSACRTAHSAAKEESETHAAETSQSSVSEDSSFASLFRSLSLRADSIVLWLQDSETVPTATFPEEGIQTLSADSNLCSSDSGFTAQSTNSTSPSARPSSRGRTMDKVSASREQSGACSGSAEAQPKLGNRVAKVLIGGVHLESQAAEQKATSTHARDSLSARESRDSSLSESDETKPPNLWNLVLQYALIYTILGLVITFGILALRRALKIK